METENDAKPVVTIARYQDRIPTDKTAEEAAAIHGAGAVFVDGKCYAEILRAQKPVEPAIEAPPRSARRPGRQPRNRKRAAGSRRGGRGR